jgi:hypothetical protein
VLRKSEPILSPLEQEKLLREAAARKRDFIPKSHTEGTRAQRLLDSIGAYCYDQTFAPNAPYAPGVTGVRLSRAELVKLNSPGAYGPPGWSCNACWQSVPPRIFWCSGKARPPGHATAGPSSTSTDRCVRTTACRCRWGDGGTLPSAS